MFPVISPSVPENSAPSGEAALELTSTCAQSPNTDQRPLRQSAYSMSPLASMLSTRPEKSAAARPPGSVPPIVPLNPAFHRYGARRNSAGAPTESAALHAPEASAITASEYRSMLLMRGLRHVRQPVRDAFVAVDAGFFLGAEVGGVHVGGARALAREVHVVVAVAVSALEGIVRLHARPLVLSELEALVEELLARADRAEELSPHLFRGLHLARDLVRPVVRHVAVGADGAHAAAVGVMDSALELGEDVLARLVAALAERLGVRELHRGVEAAPEHDACDERADHQEAQA